MIEIDLPIKKISEHSRREKSIRHGHISTMHLWWARRPLAACRAVVLAALIPDPADPNCPHGFRTEVAQRMQVLRDRRGGTPRDWEDPLQLRAALLEFIADFSDWDSSNEPDYLETSRALVRAGYEALGGARGSSPLVLDPFAGGGAIPIEALRVGAEAHASDLNPVAVLLNKVVLEYLPKYGHRLADKVEQWGGWVRKKAFEELGSFYPAEERGAVPAAYLWARTILSEAPGGGDVPVEVPLVRSLALANRTVNKVGLRWVRDSNGRVRTEIVSITYADATVRRVRRPLFEIHHTNGNEKWEEGTCAGGAATCPVTGFTTQVESVRAQLSTRQGGCIDARLLAVVTSTGREAKSYRPSNAKDIEATDRAQAELERRRRRHEGSNPLIPDGEINHLRGFFNIVLYGMTRWGHVFTPRQALALSTLARLTREAGESLELEEDRDFAIAVQTCLALAVDRQADYCSSLCIWSSSGEFIAHTFTQGQALPMRFDFVEVNPFSDASGNWDGAIEWIVRVCRNLADAKLCVGHVEQASATEHVLPDDSVDALITAPPYYAAVPYADLSDFFYVWLQRSVGDRYRDLLGEALSPKASECVSLAHRAAMYRNKNNVWFEQMMGKACAEGRRVTKPEGIGVWVFANKETEAWEAMLAALVSSGWVVTASWPIDTERGARLRARNSAALASSIHIVCRPRKDRERATTADWRDVLSELPKRLRAWMPRLAAEGIIGADAIFACLGPALEIYSSYSRVEKASGEEVALSEYLEHVWAAVSREALSMIFAGADASGFEEDARLSAMWLWTVSTGPASADASMPDSAEESDGDEEDREGPKSGGFMLPYDAARKIAQGLGAHLVPK